MTKDSDGKGIRWQRKLIGQESGCDTFVMNGKLLFPDKKDATTPERAMNDDLPQIYFCLN